MKTASFVLTWVLRSAPLLPGQTSVDRLPA
jgi:hypothetical protein